MAYNKNLNIGPNNVVNISGSLITITGSVSGSQISGTTAQFTSFTASNFKVNNDLYVSGGVTVGNYVQLLPVGSVIIPTNQTASYIYTSGSTNDMYFTQYQPGSNYNNTTRLRWLESTLSTGLLHGGVLSTVNGTTTFSLTSGSGLIITYNASTGSDPYPTIQFVNWTASVSQSLNYVTASQISYISLDQHGEILQSPTPPTFAQLKDRIYIGRVLHQTGSITNGATNTPPTAYGLATSTADFIRAIGPLKIDGHFLAASGSSLSLTKTAGDSYVEGRNYALNPNIPNIVLAQDDPAVTVSKIYRQHVSGGQPVIDTGIANAGYTEVKPGLYQDTNGNLQTVDGNSYSVQRVFWFPRAVNRALFVYYGQAVYANLDDAIAGITTENFTEGENTKGSAILVAFLVMRGNAANFDTPSTARIYQASTFRGGGAGGGGSGGGGGTTLPAGSNTYVQFNDVGSFGADSGFTFNKLTHGLTVTGTGSFGSLTTSDGITATGTGSFGAAYVSGNLGVGISNPAFKVDVRGNTTSDLYVGTGDGTAVYLSASNTGVGGYSLYITADGSGAKMRTNSSARDLQLGTNSTTALTIDTSQKVGIGTTTPNAKLDVNSDTNNTFAASFAYPITANQWSGIHFGYRDSGNASTYRKSGLVFERTDDAARGKVHILNNNGADASNAGLSDAKVTILPSGRVGVNITSPISTLDVRSGSVSDFAVISSDSTAVYISASNGTGGYTFSITADGSGAKINTNSGVKDLQLGTNNTSSITISTGQNVGVGTTAPNAKLDVNGSAIISGSLTVTGAITELSTRRIKTNIETLNNQLTTISKLNPVSYTRIDDGRKEYGFISEEVKQIYPEFVVGEGINYPKMVSVLVSAVKELTDKIEKQQTEIELLKNKKKTVRGKK